MKDEWVKVKAVGKKTAVILDGTMILHTVDEVHAKWLAGKVSAALEKIVNDCCGSVCEKCQEGVSINKDGEHEELFPDGDIVVMGCPAYGIRKLTGVKSC